MKKDKLYQLKIRILLAEPTYLDFSEIMVLLPEIRTQDRHINNHLFVRSVIKCEIIDIIFFPETVE